MYTPQPIDTTDVKLPKELEQLVEEMSKNVHEVWAETRIKQGWTYGEQRNDELKTHPCLVPYEDLPEEEKEYDRNTSIGTLKLIMKLGFKIDFDSLEMTKQESDLFNVWYKLDNNALPEGEYVLQGRTGESCKKEVWENQVVKPLGVMFSRNANRLHNESLYGLSATEQEIRQGALSVRDAKEHVLAYIRDINKRTVPNEVLYDYFEEEVENQEKLEALRNSLHAILSEKNIIDNKDLDYHFLSTADYRDSFKKKMQCRIMSVIDNVINNFNEEIQTENERHIEYALNKARHFVGREKELLLIKQYIVSSETKPLWIKGPSGIGKSSLLAKIVEEYNEHYDIICRFCGTTEESSDAISVVKSIWEEFKGRDDLDVESHRIYQGYYIGWDNTPYEKTQKAFSL